LTKSAVVESVPAGNRAVVDAFLPRIPQTLGDLVWNDTDKDGVRDTGESGVAGVTFVLTGTETTSGAAVTRRTVSDNEGNYIFGGILPGTYTITLTPPPGQDLTSLARGTDRTIDSDYRQGIRQLTSTLGPGGRNVNLDAGLVPSDGKLWKNQIIAEDVDDNGVVTPLDALLVIIDLNASGARPLPAPTVGATPQPFIDVDGNDAISPLDALLVIIRLNSQTQGGEGEATSGIAATLESTVAPASAVSMSRMLPPEFFAPGQSGQADAADDEEAEAALDAFFREVGA
jgi:hypothetical protein